MNGPPHKVDFLASLAPRLARWAKALLRALRHQSWEVVKAFGRALRFIGRTFLRLLKSAWRLWYRVESKLLGPLADLILNLYAVRSFLLLVAGEAWLVWKAFRTPWFWVPASMFAILLLTASIQAFRDYSKVEEPRAKFQKAREILIVALRWALRLLLLLTPLYLSWSTLGSIRWIDFWPPSRLLRAVREPVEQNEMRQPGTRIVVPSPAPPRSESRRQEPPRAPVTKSPEHVEPSQPSAPAPREEPTPGERWREWSPREQPDAEVTPDQDGSGREEPVSPELGDMEQESPVPPLHLAKLFLVATPSDASVYLDGKYVGLARDLESGIEVSRGNHQLEVARPGYSLQARSFVAGNAAEIHLTIGLEELTTAPQQAPIVRDPVLANLEVTIAFSAEQEKIARQVGQRLVSQGAKVLYREADEKKELLPTGVYSPRNQGWIGRRVAEVTKSIVPLRIFDRGNPSPGVLIVLSHSEVEESI